MSFNYKQLLKIEKNLSENDAEYMLKFVSTDPLVNGMEKYVFIAFY